jgi:hypothetical protein
MRPWFGGQSDEVETVVASAHAGQAPLAGASSMNPETCPLKAEQPARLD